MKSTWPIALAQLWTTEGGFVDDPADPGGATNLGVSLRLAKALKLDVNGDGVTDKLDIRQLTKADATIVYDMEFWHPIQGDYLPAGLDYALFDFAVNSGVSRSVMFLQRILRVAEDGHLGPLTLAAIAMHDARDIIGLLSAARKNYVRSLSTYARFGKGWDSRIARVRSEALSLAPVSPAITEARPKMGGWISTIFSNEVISSVERKGLAILGTYLASHGWATADQATSITGALFVLVSFLTGVVQAKLAATNAQTVATVGLVPNVAAAKQPKAAALSKAGG